MAEIDAIIQTIEPLSPTVTRIVLRPAEGHRFEHLPGQHLMLVLDSDDGELQRYYSIASAPVATCCFELCVTSGPTEEAYELIQRLEAGDHVRVAGPGGSFRLREPVDRDLLFIATGTGIAPLRAMLQQLDGLGTRRAVTLLFGVRTESDLLYREQFERPWPGIPDFRFEPTLSAAATTWRGRRGRVQEHLDDVMAGRDELDVYVCGHGDMVASVTGMLAAHGIDPAHVHYERYG